MGPSPASGELPDDSTGRLIAELTGIPALCSSAGKLGATNEIPGRTRKEDVEMCQLKTKHCVQLALRIVQCRGRGISGKAVDAALARLLARSRPIHALESSPLAALASSQRGLVSHASQLLLVASIARLPQCSAISASNDGNLCRVRIGSPCRHIVRVTVRRHSVLGESERAEQDEKTPDRPRR
jgi:hypothetical protein